LNRDRQIGLPRRSIRLRSALRIARMPAWFRAEVVMTRLPLIPSILPCHLLSPTAAVLSNAVTWAGRFSGVSCGCLVRRHGRQLKIFPLLIPPGALHGAQDIPNVAGPDLVIGTDGVRCQQHHRSERPQHEIPPD
jgi:hypothetical protein